MVKPNMESLDVQIQFTYEAEVFDDDPTDAFEIARLEKLALENDIRAAIDSVLGDIVDFEITVKPRVL